MLCLMSCASRRADLTLGAQHYTHLGDRAPCSSSCSNTLALPIERRVTRSDGVEAELAECQRHAGGHTQRVAQLLGRLRAQTVGSRPTPCPGWAAPVGASRFLPSPRQRVPGTF